MRLLIVLGLVFCAAVITASELRCEKYLVAGVSDDMLTASSYWCEGGDCVSADHSSDGASPKYARLNSTGLYTGAWTARTADENQYIQVNFGSQKMITGIVLLARETCGYTQWVKNYKLLTSADCNAFQIVQDTNGEDTIFAGNTGVDKEVISYLDTSINAQCVRINPTAWNGNISLRFDVIGLE